MGSAPVADLVEGRVQATFSPVAFTLAMIEEGKLLALAVSTRDPMVNPIMVPTALSADINYENMRPGTGSWRRRRRP
jgi:tripartite-type tricarboxylate transporter receptor subunit TctC